MRRAPDLRGASRGQKQQDSEHSPDRDASRQQVVQGGPARPDGPRTPPSADEPDRSRTRGYAQSVYDGHVVVEDQTPRQPVVRSPLPHSEQVEAVTTTVRLSGMAPSKEATSFLQVAHSGETTSTRWVDVASMERGSP